MSLTVCLSYLERNKRDKMKRFFVCLAYVDPNSRGKMKRILSSYLAFMDFSNDRWNEMKQKRSTEGCSKFKGPEIRQVQERLVSTLEHKQVQSGTGPGVGRSKRPLLACRNRCICSMETLHN